MRRLLALTAVVAVAVLASAAMAQEGERPVRRDGEGPPRMAPRPLVVLREAMSGLNLSDEQKKQVAEAVEKFEQEMKASAEANRQKFEDLEKQMRAAREAQDEAKLRELREQAGRLRADMEGKFKDLVEQQIKPILTEEQTRQFAEAMEKARRGPPPRPGLRPELLLRNAEQLGLSAEQKEQIETLAKNFREAMAKIGEERNEENAKARRELAEQFHKDLLNVLTDEQKEKVRKLLAEQRPDGPQPGGPMARMERVLRELNLTEEQKKSYRDLQKAFEEQMKAANEQERPQLARKFVNDVKALLNEEQKAKFEKLMAPPREGDRPRPRPQGEPRE